MARNRNAAGGPAAALGLTACLLAFVSGGADAAWVNGGADAGSAASAAYGGDTASLRIRFSCGHLPPPMVTLTIAGKAWRLQDGMAHSIVADVDGTAFLLSATVRADRGGFGDALVSESPLVEMKSLLAALKRGALLEISGPVGRFEVPLTGSGKALQALEEGCA